MKARVDIGSISEISEIVNGLISLKTETVRVFETDKYHSLLVHGAMTQKKDLYSEVIIVSTRKSQ
jgi:hypothetical protein